jgi:hypothetical protein
MQAVESILQLLQGNKAHLQIKYGVAGQASA